MSVAAVLAGAAARLAAALDLDARDARLEARVLASHAWSVDTAWLLAHDTDPVETRDRARYDALVTQRAAGMPVAYIVGRREFYGRDFEVTPEVLIPRPDTEILVERALERIPDNQAVTVLDLGTGSGCIALTLALERPRARVTAVDRSPAALALAQRNAARLGGSVDWHLGDWFAGLGSRRFDVIVGNPPYIADNDPHLAAGDLRFEPGEALAAGADGLADLRHLCRAAPAWLTAGGWLLLEHGYEQDADVRALLAAADFADVGTWHDLGGHPRVTGGRKAD